MKNVVDWKLTDEQRQLVESNIKLVYKKAHDMGVVSEDLIQEGMLGLIDAARNYNPDFGASFSSFACSYIWGALHGSYSDKKNRKKSAVTSSLDDPDLNIQPSDGEVGFFDYLSNHLDSISETVIRGVVSGLTKSEIRELLNISKSQLNSILSKVGEELYGKERNSKKG